MATWRNLIQDEMSNHNHNEVFDDVIHCTLSDNELDEDFCDGYGSTNGKPFTLWTSKRVYFPVTYDGEEWVGSVPRDITDEITYHVGGS